MITGVGCGGGGDRHKRPVMGAVAGRLSDLSVITSDNPRSEDPGRIIEEIQRGLTPDTRRDAGQRSLAIVDRRAATSRAIELAGAGDLVLVARKGHEKYQVIGDRVEPFDDVAVAREALARSLGPGSLLRGAGRLRLRVAGGLCAGRAGRTLSEGALRARAGVPDSCRRAPGCVRAARLSATPHSHAACSTVELRRPGSRTARARRSPLHVAARHDHRNRRHGQDTARASSGVRTGRSAA